MTLLSFENIVDYQNVILLFLIPAAINFSILIYSFNKLNESKGNTFFALYVCLLGLWQIAECFMRLSKTVDDSLQWYRISEMLILFILLYGNLFVFRFTGMYKKISSKLFFCFYIFPIIIFFACIQLGLDKVEIIPSSTWHWVANPQPFFVTLLISAWLIFGALTMLIPLWIYFFKAKKNSIYQKQLLLLALGLSFPIIIGIIVELLFPLVFGWDDIPISASLVTIFSITSFIAIVKYNMFDFSPRHHWNEIIESINEGIIITNKKNEIMYANKSFCDLVGISSKELDGKKATMISANNHSDQSKNEVEIETRNGDKIWTLWSQTPYRNSKGVLIGYIGFCTNIHQIKEAKNKLKAINDELELYIYKSSHDLRGPIASMLGLINLWKTESTDKVTRSYLDMMEPTAKKLDEALVSLVKAMKINETTKFNDSIDFESLTEEILSKYHHFPDFKRISITREITLKNEYVSNKFILEIILQNIIENAIKYQKPGFSNPYLKIKVSEIAGGKIELCFEDNGIGMNSDIQSKVFEMYFRGSLNSKGSGLGLYLVKKAVEKLNGELFLESKIDQGSKFIFSL